MITSGSQPYHTKCLVYYPRSRTTARKSHNWSLVSLVMVVRCNDLCHTPCSITPIYCHTPYSMIPHTLSYSLQNYTPCIVILLTALYPIHCHSLYTLCTPSANSIDTYRYVLSGSTSLARLLGHLFMTWPGRHRQPYYWYILSCHVQFTTVSPVVSFHVVL